MNEEIRGITNKGKAAKNECENLMNLTFLELCTVYIYKKLVQFFFHTCSLNFLNKMHQFC